MKNETLHYSSFLNPVLNEAIPEWTGLDGSLLQLYFEAHFDLKKIKNRKPNLWRYREAIPPIPENFLVSFEEGYTPMLPVVIDGKKVHIKQEQLFTSGSYKDRGATVLISKANSLGINHVIQDSSGNAGCAIAAYAAKAGMQCQIYIPSSTSAAKVKQIEAYGATTIRITGSREDTAAAAFKASKENYYASHCYNPYFLQGTKTFAYEVCEQSGWKAPDAVVLPCGNGTLVLGCFIGFKDLLKAGIIQRMPKIIAVQSALCAPLFDAYTGNNNPIQSLVPTLAEGIAIRNPVRGSEILEAVKQTGGTFIAVEEDEIKDSLRYCSNMGYYIEPTAAATIAGLRKYMQGYSDENIVTLFSGHGLKK